jgi:hypothetical protein
MTYALYIEVACHTASMREKPTLSQYLKVRIKEGGHQQALHKMPSLATGLHSPEPFNLNFPLKTAFPTKSIPSPQSSNGTLTTLPNIKCPRYIQTACCPCALLTISACPHTELLNDTSLSLPSLEHSKHRETPCCPCELFTTTACYPSLITIKNSNSTIAIYTSNSSSHHLQQGAGGHDGTCSGAAPGTREQTADGNKVSENNQPAHIVLPVPSASTVVAPIGVPSAVLHAALAAASHASPFVVPTDISTAAPRRHVQTACCSCSLLTIFACLHTDLSNGIHTILCSLKHTRYAQIACCPCALLTISACLHTELPNETSPCLPNLKHS